MILFDLSNSKSYKNVREWIREIVRMNKVAACVHTMPSGQLNLTRFADAWFSSGQSKRILSLMPALVQSEIWHEQMRCKTPYLPDLLPLSF